MGQLLEVTLVQKNNTVLLETQPLLINAGRINLAEEDGAGCKILYGSGYGVSQDTLIVEESYASIQAAIEAYEPGNNIEVPVIKSDNNERSFTATIAAPGISYVSEDTEDPTNSLIMYVQPNMVTFKNYVVALDFDEIMALIDGSGAIWGQITGTLSNQTDLQSALNAKQDTITGGATTIASSNLTADRALISNGAGKVAISSVTATELAYVSGVTSAIQTQLNAKEPTLTFSTGLTRETNTITSNLSTGIAGGQTATGGVAASENLTLRSTSHATKGKLIFGTSAYDEVNNRLGINISSPTAKIEIAGAGASDATFSILAKDSASAQLFKLYDGGRLEMGPVATNCLFVGNSTGQNPGANLANTGFGSLCLTGAINGNNNSGFGYRALNLNTDGIQNTAIGSRALEDNTTGLNNTSIGHTALANNIDGFSNTGVGAQSLVLNESGVRNTAVGNSAGNVNVTGNDNIFIGFGSAVSADGWDSSVAIGTLSVITASNQFVVGSTAYPINNYYFGIGVDQVSDVGPISFNPTGITAGETDAAANLNVFNINGAVGTGTGIGGDIVFNTAPAGGAGSARNALVEKVRISQAGVVTIANTLIVGSQQTYAISNVSTDRTYDANATTLDEIADVLGTLIADLRTIGLVL